MTENDVIRRLRSADRTPVDMGRDVDVALDELLDEILATSRLRPVDDGEVGPSSPQGRSTSRRPFIVLGAAAGIVGVAIAGFVAGRAGEPQTVVPEAPAAGAGPTSPIATSTTVVQAIHPVLDEIPLTVLPDDRWVMTYLDQHEGVPAEMQFLIAADAARGTTVVVDITEADGNVTASITDDGRSLALAWYPYDRSEEWQGEPAEPVEVLGHEATVFVNEGAEYIAVIPLETGSLQITLEATSRTEFERTMDGLHIVDASTFDAALAPSVVRPAEREATIAQMLFGVPRAPGVDVSALADVTTFQDRYQLGAAVAGAHACGWFDRWFAGVEAGDSEMAEQAAGALRTSRTWPVLTEMSASGAYPDVLWEFVAAADGAGQVDGGPTREAVASGLGCSWAPGGARPTVPVTPAPSTS